jgi:hypothetical protein
VAAWRCPRLCLCDLRLGLARVPRNVRRHLRARPGKSPTRGDQRCLTCCHADRVLSAAEVNSYHDAWPRRHTTWISGDFFWLLIWSFFFVCYLMILFQIIGDLFRDKELSGWWKALWIVALIVVPFLSALIYLIARGRGMAERQAGEVRRAQVATDSYIQQVAGRDNPADQIATAKGLLDSGTISPAEFEQLKAAALA